MNRDSLFPSVRFIPSTLRLGLISVLVGLIGSGCEKTESQTDTANVERSDREVHLDNHQRMVRRLATIRDQARQSNPYLGEGKLQQWQAEYKDLLPHAPVMHRLQLLTGISVEQLKMGENRAALETLGTAQSLIIEALVSTPMAGQASIRQVERFLKMNEAIAWLRIAETENCVNCQTGESCLFPIEAGGVHENREASLQAHRLLKEILQSEPENLTAIWLLNVTAMTAGIYPDQVPAHWLIPESRWQSTTDFRRFRNISRQLEIDSVDLSGGMIVDDFDGDGWLDVVNSTSDTSGTMKFYRNNRDGRFTDRTAEAGLSGMLGGLNMIQGDYDNDGDLDVFVFRGAWWEDQGNHENSLLQNQGNGTFRDVTLDVGLSEAFPSLCGAWADFDNDGDLDLFVGADGGRDSRLYENRSGKFQDIARAAGVTNNATVRGVAWGDYNEDGLPDLYVSNLGGHNKLYRNNGDRTFTDVAFDLNVSQPRNSFTCWFWDFDNDGRLDIFCSAYDGTVEDVAAEFLGRPTKCEFSKLYRQTADGTFEDVSAAFGLNRVSLTMGANFGDADGDGFEDFYLGTGNPEYTTIIPNSFFRNNRGQGFEELTTAAGLGHLQKGHGIAFADFDRDGDQDIFIQLGGAYRADVFGNALFENPGFGNRWIEIQPVGVRSNHASIGATVRVEFEEGGRTRTVHRVISSGGSFGANPLRAHIGLGQATRILKVEVFWPASGIKRVLTDVELDQRIQVVEIESGNAG